LQHPVLKHPQEFHKVLHNMFSFFFLNRENSDKINMWDGISCSIYHKSLYRKLYKLEDVRFPWCIHVNVAPVSGWWCHVDVGCTDDIFEIPTISIFKAKTEDLKWGQSLSHGGGDVEWMGCLAEMGNLQGGCRLGDRHRKGNFFKITGNNTFQSCKNSTSWQKYLM
jgi:hypothetical protein